MIIFYEDSFKGVLSMSIAVFMVFDDKYLENYTLWNLIVFGVEKLFFDFMNHKKRTQVC